MKKRVLCVVADGFEEIEMVTPVDLLRRAGVEVVTASLKPGPVKGRSRIVIEADAVLEELDGKDFDVLFIPGGPAVGELRRDGRAVELARGFAAEGKRVAAICAAPLVLLDAGLLEGARFTAHSSTRDELPEMLDSRVEVDGLVVTSRGAGTALDFGLELVELLAGDEAAREVAEAIMA